MEDGRHRPQKKSLVRKFQTGFLRGRGPEITRNRWQGAAQPAAGGEADAVGRVIQTASGGRVTVTEWVEDGRRVWASSVILIRTDLQYNGITRRILLVQLS